VLPDSGWVTAPIDPDDVEATIGLFRMTYDRAVGAARRRPPDPSRSID
jgi:hypothetical protein